MLVGPAAVRPDICPQPTIGATVRLVCTLSSPFPGAVLTVEWCGPCVGYLHTARLVVLLQWDLAKGVLTGMDPQGAQGGWGRLSLLCHGEGPCSTGREAGPLERWLHRSTELSVWAVQASSVKGNGSLWNFGLGDGRGKWHLIS